MNPSLPSHSVGRNRAPAQLVQWLCYYLAANLSLVSSSSEEAHRALHFQIHFLKHHPIGRLVW